MTSKKVSNIDYRQATKEATALLLAHGRKVGLVTGPGEFDINRDFRLEGYTEALKEAGAKFKQDLVIQKQFTYADGDKIAAQLIAAKANAAVISDDEIAVAVLNALTDRGVKVPQDFEIITGNNSMLTQMVRPKLSSIQIPLYDIGAVAMRLLTKIMNSEEVEEHQIILPHRFIARGSTLEDKD